MSFATHVLSIINTGHRRESYLDVQVESQWLLPSLQQTPSHT